MSTIQNQWQVKLRIKMGITNLALNDILE